jgi:hypothetical protein
MPHDRRNLLLSALSVVAAGALLASPAFADDGRGGGGRSGGGGDSHDGRAATTTTTTTTATVTVNAPQPRDNRGRDNDDHAAVTTTPVATPQVQVRVEHENEEAAEHQALPAVVSPSIVNIDNRGHDGDDDDGANRGPGNAEDRGPLTVNDLVTALNNQVAALTNAPTVADVDNDDAAAAVGVEHLRVVSLSTLTASLSAADATTITNTVNANTGGVQSFLSGGSTNAMAIDSALSSVGIAQSSVLAILGSGDRLLIVTA